MSDLISRQAILKHIEKVRQDVQMMDDTHRASIIMNGMYLCEKAVMNQPSVQPDTRRATWAIHTYMPHNYYCTNCKQDSPYNKIWDFCPHCGFKMEDYV